MVRQVKTSSVQPQLQASRSSIAWISASFSPASVGARERPSAVGSRSVPIAPRPASESCTCRRPRATCRTDAAERRRDDTATAWRSELRRAARTFAIALTPFPAADQRDPVAALRPAATAPTAGPPPGHMVTIPPNASTKPAEPDPPHQRVDVEPVDRFLGPVHRPGEHHVQVFPQAAPDPDLGGRLEGRPLEAVHVLPLLAGEQSGGPAVHRAPATVAALTTRLSASYCEMPTWVKRVGVAERAPELDRFPRLERGLALPLERHAGERHEVDQDARRARCSRRSAGGSARSAGQNATRHRLAVHPPAGADAALELLDDVPATNAASAERHQWRRSPACRRPAGSASATAAVDAGRRTAAAGWPPTPCATR